MIFILRPGPSSSKANGTSIPTIRSSPTISGAITLLEPEDIELTDIAKALLEEWLKNPAEMAQALGLDEKKLQAMTPEELIQYFLDRLKEQTEAHHGGNRWIGTGGTSPVGHSGHHPGGMRVGGAPGTNRPLKWPWSGGTKTTPRKAL